MAYTLLLLVSSSSVYAQKSFSTKAIRPYAMPIYSINTSGVEKRTVYDNYDSNGVRQYRRVSNDKTSTVPGKVIVKNNINFAAGLDYESWLPKRFFIGAGAEFRTLNNTVRYEYEIDKFLADNSSLNGPTDKLYTYHQQLNLLSFSLHVGRNFRIKNHEFEVRLGASAPFTLNTIEHYEHTNHFFGFSRNGYDYLLPYTYQQNNNFNRPKFFQSETQRLHFYLGSNRSVSIFPRKKTKLSYGLQLNILFSEDHRSLMFRTFYNYSMQAEKVYYKNQLTTFSYTKVPELCLKIGLEL